MKLKALATDLDGTLIPLDGDRANVTDLGRLESWLGACGVELVFVTGRHLASVLQVTEAVRLPRPEWMICDVGATVLRRGDDGQMPPVDAYAAKLGGIVGEATKDQLAAMLADVPGIRLQEAEKQSRFKLSFYADGSRIEAAAEAVQSRLDASAAPYGIIASVDPFNGDGLIDLLPRGVTKAFALAWLAEERQWATDELVFAGDSGNDTAALTAGYPAILVANAADSVRKTVSKAHAAAGTADRLFLATRPATSGVLEGVQSFASRR